MCVCACVCCLKGTNQKSVCDYIWNERDRWSRGDDTENKEIVTEKERRREKEGDKM